LISGDEKSEEVVSFGVRQKQAFAAVESSTILCFQNALDGMPCGRVHPRSDIVPIALREAFEFRSCANSRRHINFLLRSTEQIVLRCPDQFLGRPPTALILESAHNAKWRAIKLAADQARSASQFISYGFSGRM
jgi:hypothetical protein